MAVNPGNYLNTFTAGNVSSNVITFTGTNTFVNGQAVTYYAPSSGSRSTARRSTRPSRSTARR